MNEDEKKYPYAKIASGVGFTIGLIYAFKTESGFWKGWGYAILGSIALGGIGYGVDLALNKDKDVPKQDPNKGRDLSAAVYEGDIDFR